MATLLKDLREDMAGNEEMTKHLRAIAALGYQTLEHFEGAARAARPSFESYLETDVKTLLQSLPETEPVSDAALAQIRTTVYGLGGDASSIKILQPAPDVFFTEAELPGSIDMTAEMPEIRNQNPRGTCIAHATLAVFEHFLGKQQNGQPPDLSEQFLTYLCKENDHPYVEGSSLSVSFPLLVKNAFLQEFGCCLEQTWPDRK